MTAVRAIVLAAWLWWWAGCFPVVLDRGCWRAWLAYWAPMTFRGGGW